MAEIVSRSAGSQTLERGLRVLRVLGEHPDGLSVSELATELGTHRAGVYRLVGPLADERLVVRDRGGRYLLGAGLIELASRVRGRLRETATPELQRLADDISATTALTVRDGDEAIVAAVLTPRRAAAHLAYRAGLRHPLDRAAPGMAMLAALPPVPGERAEVAQARQTGWAASTGELLPGATGVGVALDLPGHAGEASISAVWIEKRDLAAAAAAVKETAVRIAAGLR